MKTLRAALARCLEALPSRSSARRSVHVSRTRVRQGLACDIEESGWTLSADVPAHLGGRGLGPTPGALGRAALGSCLALGYMATAARVGVPIASLELEIEVEVDRGSLQEVCAAIPGAPRLEFTVTVESDAPEGDVRRVLDETDACCLALSAAARPQGSRRTVRIVPRRL